MSEFNVVIHAEVLRELRQMDARIKRQIKTAIETRLAVAPHRFGKRLSHDLSGFWKLRVGDYRVVFKIDGKEVVIFRIGHRKEVYHAGKNRLPSGG